MTSAGIEPATFQFVAQNLNHYAEVKDGVVTSILFLWAFKA